MIEIVKNYCISLEQKVNKNMKKFCGHSSIILFSKIFCCLVSTVKNIIIP